MGKTRIIKVDGRKVGLTDLDMTIDQMAPEFAERGDDEVAEEMLRRLGSSNYFAPRARPKYAKALVREFRSRLGQPHAEEQGGPAEIKVLGQGCSQCRLLTERIMQTLANMGLAADVEHVTDLKEIAGYGVLGSPALVINKKVVSVGKVLEEKRLIELFVENGLAEKEN